MITSAMAFLLIGCLIYTLAVIVVSRRQRTKQDEARRELRLYKEIEKHE